METLRKKSMKKALPMIIFLYVFAIVFLGLCILLPSDGTSDITDYAIILVITVLFPLVGAIYYTLMAATGRYQKEVQKYIDSTSNPALARQEVEQFISTVPIVHDVQVDNKFLCIQVQPAVIFTESKNLVWAYKKTTTHRWMFIPMIKTHSLILCTIDGKSKEIRFGKEKVIDEVLNYLSARCPKAIVGYSQGVAAKFSKKHMQEFLNIKYNKS